MNKIRLASWVLAVSTLLWQTSGGALALEPPTFQILTPAGGENWEIGSTQAITWFNGGYTLADIYYSTTGNDWNDQWIPIVSRWDLTTNSDYSWTIPNAPTTTAAIRIDAYLDNGPEGHYISELFTINQSVPTQLLTVVRPNGGESWKMGSLQKIKWTSSGIKPGEKVRIAISRNNRWSTLGVSQNTGVFLWRVTGPKTNTALIRVSLVKKPAVNDVSDGYFRISNR